MHIPPTAQARHISAVTANFNGLQGLVLLPMSLWLLAQGCLVLLAPDATHWGLAALVVALGAMGLITRAYRNRFGRVRTGDAAVQVVTVVTAVALFMLSGIAAGLLTSREAPIWPQGLQLALLLTVMLLLPPLLRRRPADLRIRRYWQVMCVLVALASLVPVGLFTGGVHPLNATPELGYAAFLWVLGLCFLIGGILDHRLLVRSLHTPPAEER